MAGDGGRVPDVSEQQAEEAVWEHGHKAGRAFHRHQSVVWLVNMIEQGYLPTWVRGAYEREFATDGRFDRESHEQSRESSPASVLAALLAESPEATVAAIEALLPSRDDTVAVEAVAEWLRVRAGRTHGNGASSALYAAARDLRAEFGSARAGESNEGGNQ